MSRNTKTIYRAFVEPDFDYFAGSRRKRLPGMAWRVIPLVGVVAGSLVAGYAGFSFHAGVLAGGVAGVVVYQLAVALRGRR